MELRCRECGARLSTDDVDEDLLVADCTTCGAHFSFAGDVGLGDDDVVDIFPDDPDTEPDPTTMDGGFTAPANELVLEQQIRSRWGFVLIAVGVVSIPALGVWGLFGLVPAYVGLAMWVNSRRLVCRPGRIEGSVGPLPWPGAFDVGTARIRQVYVEARTIGVGPRRYSVVALTDDGSTVLLADGLLSDRVARDLSNRIERHLGVDRARVIEEDNA